MGMSVEAEGEGGVSGRVVAYLEQNIDNELSTKTVSSGRGRTSAVGGGGRKAVN